MKRFVNCLLTVSLFCGLINAQTRQNILSGKIYDIKSSQPLVGVNVYVNNTTIGTTTNRDGIYEMKLKDGVHEIIASMIGYEVKSEIVKIKGKVHMEINFGMKEKTYETEIVNIQDKRPEEWYKMLRIFKEYFLGKNEYSKYCLIENENEIIFHGKPDSIFTVDSYSPLRVNNKSLGYLLECSLVNFICDQINMTAAFSVKTKFTELPNLSNIIISNRESAYLGSLRHFLYNVVNKPSDRRFVCHLLSELDVVRKGIPINSKEEIVEFSEEENKYKLKFNNYLRIFYQPKQSYSFTEINNNDTEFDENGIMLNPQSVTLFGEWATRGFSYVLPNDYLTY